MSDRTETASGLLNGAPNERLEREYNLRLRHPEREAIYAACRNASIVVRETMTMHRDVAYGPGPRQKLDIFPAAEPGPVLLFFHGGYWRALDKDIFSFIAPGFVEAGVSVVLANYDLAPAASVERIVAQSAEAIAWVRDHGDDINGDPDRLVTAGHSAGGHLATSALGQLDSGASGVRGAIAISGLFDLKPLRETSINDDLHLDESEAARLSPIRQIKPSTTPLLLAVGAGETDEFRRQSLDFAAAWQAQGNECEIHTLPQLTHFDIIVEFGRDGSALHQASRAFIDRVAGPNERRKEDGTDPAKLAASAT
jgi:arylformamidase